MTGGLVGMISVNTEQAGPQKKSRPPGEVGGSSGSSDQRRPALPIAGEHGGPSGARWHANQIDDTAARDALAAA